MAGVHLTGLEGVNPLGFFAALGVQVLFAEESEQPRLWWTDDVVPHAVVDDGFTIDRIVEQALRTFSKWRESPALSPDFGGKAADDAKFNRDDIRRYLEYSHSGGPGSALPPALVSEGSLAGQGVAKPSGLYFTSGTQSFLSMARTILEATSAEALVEGLRGPWRYASRLPSLMWDVADDRSYALSAVKPTPGNKFTNPGPEALALLGFTRHPVFPSRDRILTGGCGGHWAGASYSWPLWTRPAGYGAVGALLAHATSQESGPLDQRYQWYRSWGVSRVLTSTIRRFGKGYGTFRPPQTVWLRNVPAGDATS